MVFVLGAVMRFCSSCCGLRAYLWVSEGMRPLGLDSFGPGRFGVDCMGVERRGSLGGFVDDHWEEDCDLHTLVSSFDVGRLV